MIKRIMFALRIFGLFLAIAAALWLFFHYEMNYKKTECDTSVSPDGKYELVLQAIGEPDWPFGSASGRLVLKEGRNIISQVDFKLANDGASISGSCWTVDWNENYVEVTLSTEEQEDEHILLYYDGTKEERYVAHETESIAAERSIAVKELDASVMENRENELIFDISIDDFIESYNSFYARDWTGSYLQPASQWRVLTYDSAIHSDHETSIYEFSLDYDVWSQPTIKVYVPANGDYIQEVTVNFDEHGYSETFYSEFEELCFYTLKVFFPEMDDETITDLYKEANLLGNENVFLNEDGYERGCVPCVLYHKDGIGIYPYFAIGEWTHLCVIPVSSETLNDFAQQGVEIREID